MTAISPGQPWHPSSRTGDARGVIVVLVIGGFLGLMALLPIILSHLHLKSQPESHPTQPLVHVIPSTGHEISQDQAREAWWRRFVRGRWYTLARDACFLHHVAQIINTVSSLDRVLEHVVRELVKHLAVDTGQVFLLDDEKVLQLAVSVGSLAQPSPLPNWAFTLPDLVLAVDKPLVTSDLRQWPQLRSFISPADIASALWLPLKTGGQTVGVLGLGSRRPAAFCQQAINVVTTVTSHLATAVENFFLRQRVVQERELRRALQRYVSPRLVTTYKQGPLSQPQEIIDASTRMSVLFADVRSFTPLMEQANPDAVMRVLNEYFLRMSQIIQANGGVVDEFAGDEIVASFDRISPRINDAYRAVQAGVEMLISLKTLQRRWQERELPTFDIGIGISTGAVTRGSIGSQERKALIALGSILNIASRAEAMNKKFGTHLIITQSTFEQVADLIEYDAMGAHNLQGISRPVPLYSVRNTKSNHRSESKTPYDTHGIAQIAQRRQAFAEQTGPIVGADLLS
jgi:class 3 adenylate cyclase